MMKVAANAAGINTGRVNRHQSNCRRLSDRSGKTRGIRLLIAFVPRSRAKSCTGFTLQFELFERGTYSGVKQGFTWRESGTERTNAFGRSIGDAIN